jgi:hypothetical protein
MPVLQHMVDQASMTPHAVYLHLLNVAGQLTFQGTDDPATLPGHSPAPRTFRSCSGASTPCSRGGDLPAPAWAREEGQGHFLGWLKDERVTRSAYVLLGSSEPPGSRWWPTFPVDEDRVARRDHTTKTATTGVPLKVTAGAWQIRLTGGGVLLPSLKDAFWRRPRPSRTSPSIFRPFDTDQTQVELFVVPHPP